MLLFDNHLHVERNFFSVFQYLNLCIYFISLRFTSAFALISCCAISGLLFCLKQYKRLNWGCYVLHLLTSATVAINNLKISVLPCFIVWHNRGPIFLTFTLAKLSTFRTCFFILLNNNSTTFGFVIIDRIFYEFILSVLWIVCSI